MAEGGDDTARVLIEPRVTFEEVAESGAGKIFYGALTCWWTHDPAHLGRLRRPTPVPMPGLPEAMALPCDPRGGVLFETEDVHGFLEASRAEAEKPGGGRFGPLGLETFMAAHHLNCARDGGPWCMRTWAEYEEALRASREREKGGGGGG